MKVYGDPQYLVSACIFTRNLKKRIQAVPGTDLDQLRAVLIQAGQYEQGMSDSDVDAAQACELTDAAARVFYEACQGQRAEVDSLKAIVECGQETTDATLTIKIPEGYEFYTLYPEQYMTTARTLAKERVGQRALVVGIRSIGTSLSAAVRAALEANGVQASRLTARPEGHPFARTLKPPAFQANKFDFAIIVDEGPGLSGSSVASAWNALRDAGLQSIVIFPGHANGPGARANEASREIWAQAEKRFTNAEPLPHRDVSAGKWREVIAGEWPAAFIPFERAKYLALDGVLWKFAGLGAAYENGKTGIEIAHERLQALATEGFGPTPQTSANGFISMPWLEGSRLTKADARDPAVLDFVSQYVLRFAGLPLTPEELRAGQDRLADIAVFNTRETLGDKWAQVARQKLATGRDLKMFQSYGDGRMAPHEFIRNADGRIFKVDSFGHDTDHTLIGRQSIVWDLAGLILEWELPQAQTDKLVEGLTVQGVCLTEDVLAFYEIAYAAFRMGLSNFCGSQTSDAGEKARLGAAEKSYCHKLLHLLNT